MSDLEPFGTDDGWLAFRGQAQGVVLEALGLTDGRVVEVGEAVRAAKAGRTAVLPPLRGADGARWTLVVGQDASDVSARRVASLSALLATTVQSFGRPEEGPRRFVLAERGTVTHEVDVEGEVGELAARWSVDPTILAGAAPGQALLVDPLRPEAPELAEPPEMPRPWQRGPWQWQRGGR